jgi:hypothetical protein
MIYMTRIQNISFFLLKVNNPSVRHPIWPPVWRPGWPPGWSGPYWAPRLAPRRAPRRAPHPAPVGSKKNILFYFNLFIYLFLVVVAGWKKGEKIFRFSVFNPQDPQDPRVPWASRAKSREEEGFFGLVPLVTHPSSIPHLGGLTPKFLSLSLHSL